MTPHSHPVLTLNTRQVDNDDGCLGTFLHEQFHWYAASKREKVMRAINALRGIYPTVPVGAPEGARDEDSSYLHLIICTLELDALCQLIGDERGRQQISDRRYYKWIYRQTLSDTGLIRKIMERHELALP